MSQLHYLSNRILLLFVLVQPLCGVATSYEFGPDSMPREGVAKGRADGPFTFDKSRIFEGTDRAFWIYLPADHDPDEELSLMVFQDGHAYVIVDGQLRVPIVFDNLIASGDIPRMIGVFVNPGHNADQKLAAEGWKPRSNRSVEYDSLGDAYARFLIEELLPYVEEKFEVKISKNPDQRAICGMSSGGICAWTVAWERPDSFGKVLSHIGSFTNIRGGHVYPALIRKTDRKPIRVFLQDGSNDLNNAHGSWPLANQQMAKSLAYAGYDFEFVYGDGAHNGEHGGAILPDSLRWLWKKRVTPQTSTPLEIGDWELVGEGYKFTDGACLDGTGHILFSDLQGETLYKVSQSGAPKVWTKNQLRVSGLHTGGNGDIYAATQGIGDRKEKTITVIDSKTKEVATVAERVNPNDLVVSKAGWVYFTDTGAGSVCKAPASARNMARPPTAAGGINRPNGIALSPAEDQLYVSEYGGSSVWCFDIDDQGDLVSGSQLMTLATPEAGEPSNGDGMATHSDGRLFVTSKLGIQVFDPNGKPLGVIKKPQDDKGIVSCVILDDSLFVCSADKVFRANIAP